MMRNAFEIFINTVAIGVGVCVAATVGVLMLVAVAELDRRKGRRQNQKEGTEK
jgi:hypothetical protein